MSDHLTGIFSPPGDRQATALFQVLESLEPGVAGMFDFPVEGKPAVSLGREAVMWGGMDVSQLKTAYIRGFSYTNPVVPGALEDVDWSLWQYDYISEQQKTSFLYSAMSELDRRGVKMSNPPGTFLDVSMKTDLLERMRSAGVGVPDILCTNTRSEADAFAARYDAILWRPATGRAAWQLCKERQLDALVDTDKTPVLLSSIKEGMFLRCYICDSEPVLNLKFAPPEQIPLERLEIYQAIQEDWFFPQLRDAAAVLNMRWGAIHCVINENGELFVYDIDADPVLTAMPNEVQEYLNLCLANSLLGNTLPAADKLMDTALVRSLPFLRRMLSVLFDIERSKYSGDVVEAEQE